MNILCQSLLAYNVSAEKSDDSLMGAPLYITDFSLSAFNSREKSLTFDILIIVCLGVGQFRLFFLGIFASWNWIPVSFTRLG